MRDFEILKAEKEKDFFFFHLDFHGRQAGVFQIEKYSEAVLM